MNSSGDAWRIASKLLDIATPAMQIRAGQETPAKPFNVMNPGRKP
ncbi:hypothetical protein RBWH47_05289 [Rhodopirellula baltica WH47]|uniref:Uncharacterized protein n=2 Tax=Rhodopirellula baltica TaxID=265606 RepID=Q7UNX9_RHOBA|nr:hypothetical protein RBWH47_05289 [Rhodopirellula baltica WH47]CAD75286.1 hypothetical protein RB7284 [Rhodopirellula baltica SH 1]